MNDISDPNLVRLLQRRTKEPEPPVSATPESLNLSFSTGLDNDESKQKIEYLSYQTETLEDKNNELETENQRLRILLRTRENDIFKLKNEMDELKMATTGGGLGSEKAIQRIVELSKKNRDVMSQLESERSVNRRLSNKLDNINNQEVQRKLKSAVKAKKTENVEVSPKQDAEKVLKDKLNTVTAKQVESTHQINTLKQENKLLTKLLQKEVGEGTTVQSLLANPNSWKGRSEQIAMLQTRVTTLRTDAGSDTPSRLQKQRQKDIKILENNRKKQLQELANDKEKLENDLLQSKKNYDAVKARNSTLSSELRTIRTQLHALAEKGRNDDTLINQLLTEKGEVRKEPDIEEMWRREEQISHLNMLVSERDKRVRQLEEEITKIREQQVTIGDLRPPTHPRSAPGADVDVRATKSGGFDTTYLLRATEVEKERLFELTEVLNNRISVLEGSSVQNEIQVKKYARQTVDLEKLVENLKCKRLPRCDACNKTATLNQSHLQSQFPILQDEVEVLKAHISALQDDRQSDLNKYKELLMKSRQVFLAGLKEIQTQMKS